jgi:hypothetical protein
LARAALLRGDRAGAVERLEITLENDPTWKIPRELLASLRAEDARSVTRNVS